MFLDLNGFKRINDTIGHAAGDSIIQGVADRLGALAKETCFLARIGGDEFVFVLTGAGCAARTQDLIRDVEAAMEPPFEVQEQHLHLRAAIGCAVQADDHMSSKDLLRLADLAMYAVKRRNTEVVVSDDVIQPSGNTSVTVEQRSRTMLAERLKGTVDWPDTSYGTSADATLSVKPLTHLPRPPATRRHEVRQWRDLKHYSLSETAQLSMIVSRRSIALKS